MDRRGMLRSFLDTNAGIKVLPEHAVKAFLREAGLPVPAGLFVPRGASLPDLSNLSFPLAAKVSSSQIRSKSDVGGLRLGLMSVSAAAEAASELMWIDQAEGVYIEEEARSGIEVIVGGIVDAQFGPVVMFGLGGFLVELFHDTAFALAPLARDDAFHLMERVKGYRLLAGYRGKPPCDRETLADILVTVSDLISTGLLEEIDLNPVTLYPHGAVILDAKMFVKS